jgi:hypothetical protein
MTAEKINSSRCCAFIRRKKPAERCQKQPISPRLIARWRKEARITTAEMHLLGAWTSKYCAQHARAAIDWLFPGAKARICGDSYKNIKHNIFNGLKTIAAMRRAGLVTKRAPDQPPENRRCVARARHSGQRCKQWALLGATTCRYHGGVGTLSKKWTPEERAQYRKLSQQKRLAKLQRRYERQQARERGMLTPHIGFRSDPLPQHTLEDEFASGRGAQSKPLKPLYEV